MPVTIVLGLQWGDEGKGKIVDLLAEKAEIVVRSQGGNNAGHTVVHGEQEYRFHLIPSGILYRHTICMIAGGTVIDPKALLEDIRVLQGLGVDVTSRLLISPYAHVVFPYHKELDLLIEKQKGSLAIGTTGRGIGPCYVDKAARWGIRVAELVDPISLKESLDKTVPWKNREIVSMRGESVFDASTLYNDYVSFGDQLRPFVAPIEQRLSAAIAQRANVLFEGAHGSMLDQTFGTYPYVTSSGTLSASVLAGSGVMVSSEISCIGVFKAYTTRVGGGPFPTELSSEELTHFPEHGVMREVGTTTGRKRRIGWLDLFLLRHMIRINRVECLTMTKIDILDRLRCIKVCIGYRLRGVELQELPVLERDWALAQPVFQEFTGWNVPTARCKTYEELPLQAKQYIQFIEEYTDVPISQISCGPGRDQNIHILST